MESKKDGDLELGVLFEDVISMNNIYGQLFDAYMPRQSRSSQSGRLSKEVSG